MPVEGASKGGRGNVANARATGGSSGGGLVAAAGRTRGRASSDALPSLRSKGDGLDGIRAELAGRLGVRSNAEPETRRKVKPKPAARSQRRAAAPVEEPEVEDDELEPEADEEHEELEREADGLEPELETEDDDAAADEELEDEELEDEAEESEEAEDDDAEEGEEDEELEGEEADDDQADDEDDDATAMLQVDDETLEGLRKTFKIKPAGAEGAKPAAPELPELPEPPPKSKITPQVLAQIKAYKLEVADVFPTLVEELTQLRDYVGKIGGAVKPIAGEFQKQAKAETDRRRTELRRMTDAWFDVVADRYGEKRLGNSRKGLQPEEVKLRKSIYDLARVVQERMGGPSKLDSTKALAVAFQMLGGKAKAAKAAIRDSERADSRAARRRDVEGRTSRGRRAAKPSRDLSREQLEAQVSKLQRRSLLR